MLESSQNSITLVRKTLNASTICTVIALLLAVILKETDGPSEDLARVNRCDGLRRSHRGRLRRRHGRFPRDPTVGGYLDVHEARREKQVSHTSY